MVLVENITGLLSESLATETVSADTWNEALIAGQGTVTFCRLGFLTHVMIMSSVEIVVRPLEELILNVLS